MRVYNFARFTMLTLLFGNHPLLATATPMFFEDFEVYSNHAAFATSWSAVGAPPHILDTGFGRNSSQSVQLGPQATGNGTNNRWYKALTAPVTPTDTRPISFSFDFYLAPSGSTSGWISDWQLADVRGYSGGAFSSGTVEGVIAIGVVPAGEQNLEPHNPQYFQGRILNLAQRGATYYSLDALPTAMPRSSGWHRLAALIGETSTTFFVDRLPAETIQQGVNRAFDTIVLGSDLPSSTFWIDNIKLTQIPEPSTIILIVGCLVSLISGVRHYNPLTL